MKINLITKGNSKMKFILLLILFAISPSVRILSQNNSKTETWNYHKAVLKNVFVNEAVNSQNLEILKLYEDYSYEYLVYKYKNNQSQDCIVKREIGHYDFDNNRLFLHKPKHKNIHGSNYRDEYVYVKNRGIYSSLLKSVLQKNKCIMQQKNISQYDMAYYLNPRNKTLVNNIEIEKKIDLKDLAEAITHSKVTEKEKVNELIQFIHNSVEYDYEGYNTGKFCNSQKNTIGILAGRKRLANCEGFSHTLEVLCKLIHIQCKEVDGYVKQNKLDPNLKGEYHAWNRLKVDGKDELHDITWADNNNLKWLNVNPEVLIHSHFPDHKEDQLLEIPISLNEFISLPLLNPTDIKNEFANFAPKTGVVFTDSIFHFSFSGNIKNVSVFEMENLSDAKTISYGTNKLNNFKIHQSDTNSTIEIPLKKTESFLEIKANGISYSYRVIKGNHKELYTFYLNNFKAKNLSSYIKAFVSSILLNDENKFMGLLGQENSSFLDNQKKIKPEIIQIFSNWNGSINKTETYYAFSVEMNVDSRKTLSNTKVESENRIYFGSNYLVWKKTDEGYRILKIV